MKEEERKAENPEKTPDGELQKMPHTKVRTFNPNRNSNPHSSTGGKLGNLLICLLQFVWSSKWQQQNGKVVDLYLERRTKAQFFGIYLF